MAYSCNNNFRSSGPSGNSGRSYGYGADRKSSSRQSAPAEIKPLPVPEDYVDQAEAVMRQLSEGKNSISTSKIRNLLSLVTEVYNVENLRTGDELCADSIAKVNLMRVRVAYEMGRDNKVKAFAENAKLMEYLKGISKDRKDLIRFAHYMEALVAFHKYFGGKEN